ncbi:MAG: ferredoxin [Acidimicrobiia bacterium]|nr:ferredoxin [Acidimicrobiia bacterium]MDH4366278.1 ferredoxin [Acidimicrobiia bacterium]
MAPSIRLVVDRPACKGYANCLDAAPGLIDLDEHDVAVTLAETYSEADRAALERAVDRCPARALRLEDDET